MAFALAATSANLFQGVTVVYEYRTYIFNSAGVILVQPQRRASTITVNRWTGLDNSVVNGIQASKAGDADVDNCISDKSDNGSGSVMQRLRVDGSWENIV